MSEGDSRPTTRATPQFRDEIDPRTVDASANEDIGEMSIETERLFRQAMEQTRMAICITDPGRDGNPIVYANEAFVWLTGYSRDEVVGRNCKFLQGPETSQATIDEMCAAMREERVAVVEILNYRKDGSKFWNALHIGPVFDRAGRLTHFYGSQWDVTALVEGRERAALERQISREMGHRLSNIFSIVQSILMLSAKNETEVSTLTTKVRNRIDALARAHRVTIPADGSAGSPSDLKALVGTILEPYDGQRLKVEGPCVELSEPTMTPLGITLHELATNSMKYGAFGSEDGVIRIRWEIVDHGTRLDWIEDGLALPDMAEKPEPGTGSRIIDAMIASIDGRVEREWHSSGLHVRIFLPKGA